MKKTNFMRLTLSTLMICGTLFVSGCSTMNKDNYSAPQISDPLEPMNRAVFAFNTGLDRVLFEPIAKTYVFLTPEIVRKGVHNVITNLKAPIYVTNNLLQGDFKGAGEGVARFAVNSTVGVAGLFDVADHMDLPHEAEDFGQTLAVWGVGDGFYLVLPVLGPSTLRDTAGRAADSFVDPMYWVAQNDANNEWMYYTHKGLGALDARAANIDAIEDMRKNSIDFYATVRSIYAQKRLEAIQDAAPGTIQYDIPDYEDDDF